MDEFDVTLDGIGEDTDLFDESGEDSLPEEVVEENEEGEEEDLDSLLDEGEQKNDEGSSVHKEPGYVQKRISRAVAKVEAKYNAMMQQLEATYAPVMARMQEMEAQELVRSGKVKDLEIAKELVRLRNGMPVEEKEPQPRQANGQFGPKVDPVAEARKTELEHQAERIKAQGGPDVVSAFMNNPKIQAKVVSGEMNFYDVAEYLRRKGSNKVPPTVRSANGASGQSPNAIASMSDEQFERMDRKIREEGARYRLT